VQGDYIELDPEGLEAVAIESKRTIDIDEFVPKDEIGAAQQRDELASFQMIKLHSISPAARAECRVSNR
jgi:hypothetical protein